MLNIDNAREWYEGADAVHNFDHILRVYRMAEFLSNEEGGDFEIIGAATLLHDAVDPHPNEDYTRTAHHEISANFAGKILAGEKWESDKVEEVQHCIRAHRFRSTEKPKSLEAKIVFDADKIDSIGAIGAARAIAYAALDNKPFFTPASKLFSKKFELEENEVHSAYHEYIFKLINIKDRLYTATAKKIAVARHKYLEEFFIQLKAEYLGER